MPNDSVLDMRASHLLLRLAGVAGVVASHRVLPMKPMMASLAAQTIPA